jgi:beta-glucosidase
MSDKLTIRDIARLAGVSTATVSRVLNQKPDVDPDTRVRILHIMEAQGFIPDLSAVSLASSPIRHKRGAPSAFPADFLWGVATSAYQIEGATSEDGRGPSIWDTFARQPGTISGNATADVAVDHYHRMPEDVALLASLNVNAYRFSIAWPRIVPEGRGAINERGLDFYERLVDALLARSICPLVTLYHWDLPQALHEQGGWQRRETAFAFADYAEIVARRLGDRVRWWTTLNEPWCSAWLGYGLGVHAPGIQDKQAAITAAHHLLLAHGLAVPRLRAASAPEAKIGITVNLTPIEAANEQDETAHELEARVDVLHNRWFLDPLFRGTYPQRLFTDLAVAPPAMEPDDLALISAPLDFLGVNYYSRAVVRARSHHPPTHPHGLDAATLAFEYVVPVPEASYTQMAWEIYPKGLADMLVRVQRDYTPPLILVTENGAAFGDQWDGKAHVADKRRAQYLRDHIEMLETALAYGVPLAGYFVWSFLDNFEWTDGYSKRFGIIYVDYSTQRRVIKESGRWFAAFIAAQRQLAVAQSNSIASPKLKKR